MTCNEEECSCYANGIGCQIDRMRHPCMCNIRKCQNKYGMKKFNIEMVEKHKKRVLGKTLDELESNVIENNEDESGEKKKGLKRKRKQTDNLVVNKRKKK